MRDSEKTISNLISKCSISNICYIDKNGYPVTKAMLMPRVIEGIKTFYFSTNTSSNKVQAIKDNPNTSIYFVDRRFYRGVSICGKAEILETKEAKELIWQTGDEIYYPLGVDDPDYCIIKFTGITGRYYSKFKSEDFII